MKASQEVRTREVVVKSAEQVVVLELSITEAQKLKTLAAFNITIPHAVLNPLGADELFGQTRDEKLRGVGDFLGSLNDALRAAL